MKKHSVLNRPPIDKMRAKFIVTRLRTVSFDFQDGGDGDPKRVSVEYSSVGFVLFSVNFHIASALCSFLLGGLQALSHSSHQTRRRTQILRNQEVLSRSAPMLAVHTIRPSL